ncbi:MAG: hypothetical protein ISS26_02530 [Candidatus Omnitrophica bacterium]|nr:hypothetical protein [Candidatus Omnitrophota bacterium]
MRPRYLTTVLFILCLLLTRPLFAVEDGDILYPTIGKGEDIALEESEKYEFENFDYALSGSTLLGYDTNVHLEHYDPASSIFMQNAFGANSTSQLFELCTLRLSYDITSIKYFRFSEPDLLDNILGAGIDTKVTDGLLFSLDYTFDFVDFPHDKASEYTMGEISAGVKHDITDSLYHQLIYKFSNKHYPKWKTRNDGGIVRMGDRKDVRNTFMHRLGWYISDKTFLQAENSLYFNNSNDMFLDFYDYTAIKTKGSILHLITDKFYALANAGYQYQVYRNRVVSDHVDGDERDKLLMCGASLFYDVKPGVSAGLNLDYSKNFSNEGEEKYQDLMISSGLYWNY